MTSVDSRTRCVEMSMAARAVKGLITGYQRATDHRPSPCRYVPSCSYYALEAVEVHGAASGVWLGLRRLLRCRPGGPSGWDPVPDESGRLAPDPTLQPLGSSEISRESGIAASKAVTRV